VGDPGLSLGERIFSGQGPEFADVLEALGEAITVRDREGRFVYANRAALANLGLCSLRELLDVPLSAVLERYAVCDERGRPVGADAIPSVRLLETGVVPEPLLVQSIEHATGAVRWERLKVSPLRDRDGTVVAAVTVIEDVTAVKSAEVHTRVLAESGRQLSASLDYQRTLHNVAQAALPGLADWCLVELMDGPVREQVVVAHVDPDLRPLAARLRALEPPEPTAESALRRVIASGESEIFHEISDEHLRRVAISPEQLEVYRGLSIRSAIVVPMRVAARIIGAMSFFTSVSRRRFTAEDLGVAEQLARRAAVAVENARLHTMVADVAETLQDSLLPSAVPEVPGWEIGTLYRPVPGQTRIDVGGDFYEVFDTSGNAFATIGDVTGHGVHAATITSLLRHGARFASYLEPDPVAIIRRLDEALRRREDGAMASALCAALHDHSILLCSAGHPPALIADGSGQVSEAPTSGPLLGAFTDSSWHQQRVAVGDGELVLLYTDGVTETVAAGGERFGTERLREIVAQHLGRAPQALLDALEAELERFSGGPPTDDVAALALRPRPAVSG
jgi:serine phosphatase RsbU (regulator of sigma subunit)